MSGFKRAERAAVKLKLAIQGPSGSGKTLGALAIARGLVGPAGKIAVIDTENESASLYADAYLFDTQNLAAPFTSARYLGMIKDAVDAGYDALVIDSISHQWAGAGGILNRKEAADARGGNQWTNWGPFTQEHTGFIAGVMAAPIHIIATLRAKQEYVLAENERGKQAPKKMGLAPTQREGMEYEFSVVFEMQMDHKASASKDRTRLFDGKLTDLLDGSAPKQLLDWLHSAPGAAAPAAWPPVAPAEPEPSQDTPAPAQSRVASAAQNGKPLAPTPAAAPAATDAPPCPTCGGKTRDERATKRNPRAPDFRCKDTGCKGVVWPVKEDKAPAPVVAGEGDMPIADDDGPDGLPF